MTTSIIYDDLSNSDDGNTALGSATNGFSFTTPNSGFGLTSVINDLKFRLSNPGAGSDSSSVSVGLYADNGDPNSPAPTTLIATLGTFSASDISTTPAAFDFSVSGAPQLSPSTRYWVLLSDPDGGSLASWEYSQSSSGTGVANEANDFNGFNSSNSTGPFIAQVSVTSACFAAGTRILTAAGEIAVERLQTGDLVATMRGLGFAPMSWLGQRTVDCRRHPRPHDVWPVRVSPGAFGPGRPVRELVLSPDHAVFITDPEAGSAGSLVPIRYLLNGATIRQTPIDSVTYYHVELDRHDVLMADGLAAESYLDTGNRCAFVNAPEGTTMAHPDFARRIWSEASCAPLHTDGPLVDALRTRLHRRAEACGHRVTTDPDLHLRLDGVRIEGRREGNEYVFDCPAVHLPGTGSGRTGMWLASRAGVPAELDARSQDSRRLGVAISRLAVDGKVIAISGAAGWHAAEDGWRWTDGMAALPCAAPCRVEVTIAMAAQYWREAGPEAALARAA